MKVDPKLTPYDPHEIFQALERAFKILFDAYPTDEALALLAAQSRHETARWQKMWNNNFGGLKSNGRTDYTMLRTFEDTPNGRVYVRHPFRAYPTITTGASDYLAFLGTDSNGDGKNRYGKAWDRALAGDVKGFAEELKKARYYTAPLVDYMIALDRHYEYCLPEVQRWRLKTRREFGRELLARLDAVLDESESIVGKLRELLT